jgi:probable F420-dependent oxidoreductase
MRFTVQYPIAHAGYDPGLMSAQALLAAARTAESAGFDAIAFTEHPAPSHKWLQAGGHESFDPLSALAFCAAATQRIRLMTYLMVLPYRNPLLAAKQVATVDLLSGGRVTLAVGGGYLRSEFAALGIDFEERNALFDESVEVMRGIWSTDNFTYQGRHFKALGQTARPRPLQQPYPPIWIGGNGRIARQRVAQYGQGWTPLLIEAAFSSTIRTPALSNAAELRAAVDDLKELTDKASRDPSKLDIQIEGPASRMISGSSAQIQDAVRALEQAGANWLVVDLPGSPLEQTLQQLQWYGENVISKCR